MTIFLITLSAIGVMAIWFLIGLSTLNQLIDRKKNVSTAAMFWLVGPIGWAAYWVVDQVVFELSGGDDD